ncbi:AAA family ATPase [Sutcliffiella horikoshii]|uniref:AAA family ATPase n=1 Tax=Sutcliffiella horikoshii TaxID=79883 RepID=A0A5D4SWV2_9BACI|nr:AAA family ATPase [Sutcliffiella horikoshii]TYS67833.1 AAA family ATPase [Sutcliffiella horikoshii]
MMRNVYVISGPCGVGKSTVTKGLARKLKKSVLIEGDLISAMFIGEPQPPWEEKLSIVWQNLSSLTKNFLLKGYNVVIDYVVEDELEWFCKELGQTGLNFTLHYYVLRADPEVLVERITKRGDTELISRSLELLQHLENKKENAPHLYDSTNKNPKAIINEILDRPLSNYYHKRKR